MVAPTNRRATGQQGEAPQTRVTSVTPQVISAANEHTVPGWPTTPDHWTDTQRVHVVPADDRGAVENNQLWATLTEASGTGSARGIAAAEDAVFRHYLPWARSLAATASPDDPHATGRSEYRDAAELGLAQAILAWSSGGSGHFVEFARRFILRRIRRLPTGINDRRLYGRATEGPSGYSSDTADVIVPDTAIACPPAGAEVALLDRHGTIFWVNDAWIAFGEANGATPARSGVGISYLAVCDAAQGDPYAQLVARAIRRTANGQRTGAVTMRIPCDAPNRPRWYDVLIRPRTNGDLELMGVAVALSSVSPTIWEIPTQMTVGTSRGLG